MRCVMEPAKPLSFKPLKFGTSGLRDLDENLSDREVFINTRGFLAYLLELGRQGVPGGIVPGQSVALSRDFRPSSRENRIPRAVGAAIIHSGCRIVYCGPLPTPAVTNYGLRKGIASIMVTGSHIPFGQNGIKFNRPDGEILKQEEKPILEQVGLMRQQVASWPTELALFSPEGSFLDVCQMGEKAAELLAETDKALAVVEQKAAEMYVQRYKDAFGAQALAGMDLVFLAQSSVGRSIIPAVLRELGARVDIVGELNVEAGEFLPVDTEKMTDPIREQLRRLAADFQRKHGRLPLAVMSADGDADRPVFCDEKGEFLPGDMLGVVASLFLKPSFVALPITCNSSAVQMLKAMATVVQTQVGSPYINHAMKRALAREASVRAVGYEANGGFLLGASWTLDGRTLEALPTRDAVLPMVCALRILHQGHVHMADGTTRVLRKASDFPGLFSRFTASGVVDGQHDDIAYESAETGRKIIAAISPAGIAVEEVDLHKGWVVPKSVSGNVPSPAFSLASDEALSSALERVRKSLNALFTAARGFTPIVRLNYLDGVRITFQNGEVVHLRPSGNAAEFRFYAEADTPGRAQAICAQRFDLVREMISAFVTASRCAD